MRYCQNVICPHCQNLWFGTKYDADIKLLTRVINLSSDDNCATTRMIKLSISSISFIAVTAFFFPSIP